jgi:hypothetical protein
MRYTIDPNTHVQLKSTCGISTIDGAGQSVVLSWQVDHILDTIVTAMKEHLESKGKKIEALRKILAKTREENTLLKAKIESMGWEP